jgi:fatty acid desaturase
VEQRPSPLPHLLANVALLVVPAIVAWQIDWWPAWVVAWSLQALAAIGMASAAHYASHNTLFASKRANRWSGTLLLWPILVNAGTDKAFHRQHHAATRVEGDTEYAFDGRTPISYGAALLFGGLSFVAENWWDTARTVVGRGPAWIRTERQARRVRVDAALGAAFLAVMVALTVVAPGAMFRLWIGPVLFALTFGSFLIVLPEHFRCDRVADTRLNTRSVETGRLLAWVYWNGNFHTAHHLRPNVHWTDLPAVHAEERASIAHLSPSYRSFHWAVVRSFAHHDNGPVQRAVLAG